jgi:DNA replication and repair protein RecF
MSLELIRISHLRNIREMELTPSAGVNLIWGANGSGKTSILEAIYLLGRGVSFRNRQSGSYIQSGEDHLDLFARVNAQQGRTVSVGLRKGRSESEARVDGKRVRSVSELAKNLPISIITPKTHEILERGPQYRRRFLDWGVFHVEHGYRSLVERYQRALQQRNAALRKRIMETAVWDRELCEAGGEINRIRERYLEQLQVELEKVMSRLLADREIQLEWRRGWPAEETLEQAMERAKKEDVSRGYTKFGPHRADLVVRLDGELVEKRASRGQQKLTVAAMHLAQAGVARESAGVKTVIIVDDLPAELDAANRNALMRELSTGTQQVFVTGIEQEIFQDTPMERVFHVEHGALNSTP